MKLVHFKWSLEDFFLKIKVINSYATLCKEIMSYKIDNII